MSNTVDLHVHTTASDGTYTPREVVALARESALAAIAVTDHDTVAGLAEAMAAGAELGVQVIPGIELAAAYEGQEVHILGLFVDPGAASLSEAAAAAVRDRDQRNQAIVLALAADGFPIDWDGLTAAFPGSVLGRPHIAQFLAERGLAPSAAEAYARWLDKGRPYYRARRWMALDRAIAAIRDAGGLAVVAHPLQYGWRGQELEAFVRTCAGTGCRAMECIYSGYGPEENALLLALAERYGLTPSGGSDFHGSRKPRIRLGLGIDGEVAVPADWLELLRRAAKF